MSAVPEIRFRMAARSPAEWAEFIDQLYQTHRVNESVQEIVRLTIMAALDAGYMAAVNAAADRIKLHAGDFGRPDWDQRKPIDDETIKKLIMDGCREIRAMRPPAPGEEGKG